MPLRLLAVDLPPLLRDLVDRAVKRRGTQDETIFLDLPAGRGDLEAIAVAADADVVLAPLATSGWPAYCQRVVDRRRPLLMLGLGTEDGSTRVTELRAYELRESGSDVADLSVDEIVDRALRGPS